MAYQSVIADINHQQSQETSKTNSNVYLNGKDESQYLTIEDGLESTFADEGAQTMFEVTVKSHPQATCSWYKEGTMLQTNQRIHITSYKKQNLEVFRLEIRNIKVEDSGIYSVVCRNNYHLVSSHASLLVANTQDTDGTIYYPAQETIHNKVVLEPKNAQVKQKDIIELEASFENEVDEITWYKNNEEIFEDFRTIILKSQTSSVLTIMKSTFNDTGTYYVVGRSRMDRIISSVAHVYVMPELPELNRTETSNNSNDETNKEVLTATSNSPEGSALVHKRLESAVASLGSSVMFDCSFTLNDDTFHYVIWYVGNYRVERTNSQFCVLNKEGDFFLYIKRLDPDMVGQVVCELWRALPCEPGQSKFVISTTSSLAMAPRCVVQLEKKANPSLKTRKLFLVKSGDGTSNIEHAYEPINMTKTNGNCLRHKDKIEVKITFCRLSDKGLFYFLLTKSDTEVNATIQSRDGDPRIFFITVDKSCLPPNHWYIVDVAQSDGSYIEVGVSSEPCVGLEEPPIMTAVKIRMRPVKPADDAESSVFLNIAPQEEDVSPLKCAVLRSIEEFQSEYKTTGDRLGLGSFGSVVLAQDTKGKYYAAKKVRTTCQASRDKANAEYEIMKRLQHPKVIHLVEGFQDKLNFIIVMEYLWGGELFDRVAQEEHIQEEDVVSYVRQICEALVYIHKQNIVHLDIKPENIVCRSPNSCRIKIIDFGIAKVLQGSRETRALEGTKDYIPPEILNYDKVTTACDMWSLGVVTYILLSGLTPFYSETWPEMSAKIMKAEYGYEDEAFDHVSWLSRNFVDRLLVLNPSDRLTAEQALQHSWLKYGPPKGVSARHSMRRTRENLKTYLAAYRSKWQRARNVIFAAHRLLASGHASRHSPSK